MRKKHLLAIFICTSLVLSACSNSSSQNTSEESSNENISSVDTDTVDTTPVDYKSREATTLQETHATDAESLKTDIDADFNIETSDGGEVACDNNIYTLKTSGTYTVTGKLAEGKIVVDAGDDDEINIVLSNASVTCSSGSPIYCKNAKSVKIKSEDDTYNEIIDCRQAKEDDSSSESNQTSSDTDDVEETDVEENAAIYVSCDLSLTGKGALFVQAGYNNGIQTKKDLSVKNVTLKVNAAAHALKGKDSVEIESGQILLISTGGDGIHTVDSNVSSNSNQKGSVKISDATVDIYAAFDGIDASYSADIDGDATLNIYTDSYSDYSSDDSNTKVEKYLILDQNTYSDQYDYYVYFYNDDKNDGTWVKAEYSTMISGGRNQYYGLIFKASSDYTNAAFFEINSGSTPDIDNYVASSEGDSFNKDKDGYLISSITDKTIEGSYISLNSGGNGSDKTTYSSKGIKADNNINISGGNIIIYSKDDAIHANGDVTLESGSTGEGNVEISGGNIMITASDDGIHADNTLVISGGSINVVNSYEGIEGNLIYFNGGETFVYASDDGVNASSGNSTPLVSVNGGYLDVTTPSGDTDGIDSNGSYEQTGGFVLVKGGASTGSMAGSIDVDGSITVTGGGVAALGGICETPENSQNAYSSSSLSFSAGTYTIKDDSDTVIMEFTLNDSYQGAWFSADTLITGTSYSLTSDDSSLTSWTQEDGTQGDVGTGFGGGGFGGGGFGGHHGRSK